ncbi:hypothetical protein ACELLULO517_01705 [Acidisoma cellulosilytica]|uniref:Transmembrane protein n=1 Tax=Acidisoma cellulosilyticum TaxID=2802395 RepID=A0A963YXG9_9PROT|nr:hypothetical protein [Acidisoma cellulosilyticum]MCB8878931.1 hypothetical protein [Acidisoma cellulosilyticum]
MTKTKPPPARTPVRSPGRRLRDALLLPLALLLVAFEIGLQAGARLLRRWRPVRLLEATIGRLPPWAILPLFIIPEAMSHIGGFYATYLLAQRKFLAATLVAVLIKGVGLLIALWIYQACRPALMTIRWFAWVHGKVEAARHWAMGRMREPLSHIRRAMRRVRAGLLIGPVEPGARHSGRRLAAIRVRLLTRLGRWR